MSRSAGNKRSRGFTLVELLVVVLILAILMAVALPLYLSAIANSEKRTARANMQTIANAEQSYKLQHNPHEYTDITKDADFANLTDLPATGITGPGDRHYLVTTTTDNTKTCKGPDGVTDVSVPANSFYVTSTVGSDGCYVPGVTPE
jgi:type IV pilus assembly protein PilA